jgi:hypothetical protein
MLNLLALAKQLLTARSRLRDVDDWIDEPLSHPALQRMTLEQLADLPFDRGPTATECCSSTSQDRLSSPENKSVSKRA